MKRHSHSTHEQAVLALARTRPLLRARDLAQQELPTIVLSRLVAAGKLERVARGVYGLPGGAISENRSLAEVAMRGPSNPTPLRRCFIFNIRLTRDLPSSPAVI